MKNSLFVSLALTTALPLAVSCQPRTFGGGSETLLRTDNGAGIPVPSPAPIPVRNVTLTNPDALKVLDVQTAAQSLGDLNLKQCEALNNGPHAPVLVKCENLVQQRMKEVAGFEGFLIQDFSFSDYNGQTPWSTLNCQPTRIRLKISAQQLSQSLDGIRFYLGALANAQCQQGSNSNCRLAPSRTISGADIAAKATRNGDSLEADFLFLGKCGSLGAEFKPYFADGKTHLWEAFQGNHIVP